MHLQTLRQRFYFHHQPEILCGLSQSGVPVKYTNVRSYKKEQTSWLKN